MESQATTKSEPRIEAHEGKRASSRSPCGRGHVSSPATALSAHELEAVQGSESNELTWVVLVVMVSSSPMSWEMVTSGSVKNWEESCWIRIFSLLAQVDLEDICARPA